MAVAEAWRATKTVFQVEIEETWTTFFTAFAFDILFAQTVASFRITGWCVVEGAAWITTARLTSLVAELKVVSLATVALFTSDAGFALTFTLAVTLQ